MKSNNLRKTKTVKHLDSICTGPSLSDSQIIKLRKRVEQNKKLKDLSDYFFILGGKKRLEILYLLEEQKELCVCDIADILESTISAVSHQLKILREAGFLKLRREKQVIFYSLKKDSIKKVISNLLKELFK